MQAALIAQAGYGNLEKIEKLVDVGGRLVENKDQTAYAATSKGQLNMVKFMVEKFGDDLHEEMSQKKFVDTTAKCGYNKVIGCFIEQQSNVKEQGGDALVHAGDNGHIFTENHKCDKELEFHQYEPIVNAYVLS